MKVMTSKIIISTLMLALSVSVPQAQASDHNLSSAEIKKLRFLSSAVLKSRANEKKRIEDSVNPERKQLQSVYDAVHSLEKSIQKEHMAVSLQANDNTVPQQSVGVINKKGSGNQRIIKADAGNVKVEKKTVRVNRSADTRFRKKMTSTAADIEKIRTQLESEQTPSWQFWKKKTAKDMRSKRVASVLKKTEVRLAELSAADKVSLKGIQNLRKSLELKSVEVKFDEAEPTMQTITKHKSLK